MLMYEHEVAKLKARTTKVSRRARREGVAATMTMLDRRAISIPTPKGTAYAAGGGTWDNTLLPLPIRNEQAEQQQQIMICWRH